MSSIASPTTTMRCDTILWSKVSRRSLGSRGSVVRGVTKPHQTWGVGSGTLRCEAELRRAPSRTTPHSPHRSLPRTTPHSPLPVWFLDSPHDRDSAPEGPSRDPAPQDGVAAHRGGGRRGARHLSVRGGRADLAR